MTDNEIKKALECCVGDNDGKNCFDCPLWEIDDCQEQLLLDALDIINRPQAKVIKEQNKNSKLRNERNRLQAEVERLKDTLNATIAGQETFQRYIVTAKAEAVKEFAENAVKRVEKAKLKYQKLCKEQGEEMEEHMHIHFNGIIGIINNLLKEMVGDN